MDKTEKNFNRCGVFLGIKAGLFWDAGVLFFAFRKELSENSVFFSSTYHLMPVGVLFCRRGG